MTRRGRAYTPQETTEFEGRVRQAYRESGGPTFQGNVAVSMLFYGDETRVDVWELEDGVPFLKGDTDNYLKAVLDGLQPAAARKGQQPDTDGVAFLDDRQVLQVEATRMVKGG